MTTRHRLKEYLKYLRKARSRHGIHSPFVYGFIENVLRNNGGLTTSLILVTSRHKKLVNQLIAYFNCRNILWLTNHHGEQETFISIVDGEDGKAQVKSELFDAGAYDQYPQPDLILIDLRDPTDWRPAFDKFRFRLKQDSIVLINSIHHSKQHTEAWGEISEMEEVKLSLDLYKVGLLFFREEIKEKQHFVLKS